MFKVIISAIGFTLISGLVVPAVNAFSLTPLSTYSTGIFDEGAAEIPAFDPVTQRLFLTNAFAEQIDVLDLSNPTEPSLLFNIDVGGVNSIDFNSGILAAAVEAPIAQNPGQVQFFDADGTLLNSVTVGALPDMLTFTPSGDKILVANEGEPNDDYTVDPEGSISIIDLANGVNNATVSNLGFNQFNDADLDPSIRIFGPGATVAQDLEPEYIAVSEDSSTAWVALQENNALAIVDIENETVSDLVGLGFKDLSLDENSLDVSDRDGEINFATYDNLFGIYQPDAIATYQVGGQTYIVSANEGDSRDYDGFSEEERVEDLVLDPDAFPNAEILQQEELLGRLTVTDTLGDTDGDGDFDRIYVYGARSFSIRDANGNLVFDSGDALERLIADRLPDQFNSNNDENDSFDSRSDDKGPEPEGLTVAQIGERIYVFIGLERIGGVVTYDITNPNAPFLIDYTNNRNFQGDAEAGTAGDLGPEGVVFISEADSPSQNPLLVVTNEVSGSTTIYQVNPSDSDGQTVPEPSAIAGLLVLGTVIGLKKTAPCS